MKDKKIIIIELLEKISSLEFQDEVWVKAKRFDWAFCFGETVNLLDDYQFFEDLENGKLRLNALNDQKVLESFAQNLLGYVEPQYVYLMQYDNNWITLTKQAKYVADKLKTMPEW